MFARIVLCFAVLALPGVLHAKCTGDIGYVIPSTSTETYTLGDGTVIACAGLLVVNRLMLDGAVDDGSYDFKPTDSYARHTDGQTYRFDQVYTGNILDMSQLFSDYGGTSFNEPIEQWDTSQVTTMHQMFLGATIFTRDISKWDVSKVTSAYSMFYGASSFNANISSWNTGNLTSMGHMFKDAVAFNTNISGWNVSRVSNFYAAFQGATSFNQDLSTWDTGNGFDFDNMFDGATSMSASLKQWNVCGAYSYSDFMPHDTFGELTPYFGDDEKCNGGQPASTSPTPDDANYANELSVTASLGDAVTNESKHDLGMISRETNTLLTYTIKNTGQHSFSYLEIPNFKTRGQNVDVQLIEPLNAESLAPGESVSFTLSLKPLSKGWFGFYVYFDAGNEYWDDGYAWLRWQAHGGVGGKATAAHSAISKSANNSIGVAMSRAISSVASGRIARGLGGFGNFRSNLNQSVGTLGYSDQTATNIPDSFDMAFTRAGFTDQNGWVSFTSDDLLDRHYDHQSAQQQAKLSGLPEGALASPPKNPEDGPQDPIDIYFSYTAGKYINTREGGYEGFSRNVTSGVDFVFSETAMLGVGLGYEYSELAFDNTVDGATTKDGWRLDAYGATKPSDLFSVEGLVSYSWLGNPPCK